MRISFDTQADAAYISLTETVLDPGRDSIPLEVPRSVGEAKVIMDWKDRRIVGLEVLDAASLLHPDLLALAEPYNP